jgi:hypothetical protein
MRTVLAFIAGYALSYYVRIHFRVYRFVPAPEQGVSPEEFDILWDALSDEEDET